MPSRTLPALLAAALLAGGCDNPSGSGRPGPPAQLEILAGDQQRDTVGQELPQALVVRVTDERGRPVPDQVVNFRVTAGNGSVFAGAAITNRDGEARERWTLGTVAGDTQRIEARAVDSQTGAALVLGAFWAIGSPGAPANLAATGAGERTAAPEMNVSPPPAVRVTDQYGNGVPGVSVAWAVASGGGTVSAATSQTDAGGTATIQWVLGPGAGLQALTAGAAPLPTVQLTGKLRLPGSLAIVAAPGTVAAGSSTEYVVQVRDSMGHALPNTAVQWSLQTPGGATLTPASAKSGADGIARATLTVTSLQADHVIGIRAGTATSGVGVSVAGPIMITNTSASGGRGISPVGYVQARINSTAGAITHARASLAGRETELSYDVPTGWWKGFIDMAGVAGGTYTGTINATDASGNSRVAAFTAGHDANPVVVIVEPSTESATARGSIRIRATCSWQLGTGPGNCANLYSSVRTESGTLLGSAQGRSEIDVTVPLPAGPATVRITVQWNDRQAVYFVGKDTVEVNVTP